MTGSLRSLLFVPATRPDLLRKLARFSADAVVIDLEDTVPDVEKAAARAAVPDLLALLSDGSRRKPRRYLRVNPAGTEWFDEDVRSASRAELDGVVLPKLSALPELERVAECRLPVIGGIETALGVAHAEELVRDPVAGVYFGAEDFIADMGGHRTPEGTEVLYARSRVAIAARVGGVPALDQIVFDARDEQAFRRDAELGRAIGYTGKMCVHPRQAEWANEVFAPSSGELDWARRALSAYQASESRGHGVATVDGVLVDMPAVRRARRIVTEAATDG